MARVEGGAVIISTDWPGLKDQIDTRSINFKYEEGSNAYEIFAIDGQYFYKTIIYKSGQAPQDQSSHDTWRTEFEASYKNRITDFNSTQPFYLTNIDGYSVILKDGAAPTPNDGYGIGIIGYDGSNYRFLRSDTSGRQILVGDGTAGSPTGGIITIQGISGGTTVPTTNVSLGSIGSVTPNSGAAIGFSDGTNLQLARVFDVDSGAGTQYVLGLNLRKSSSGGSVEFGTSSDPIRIDPTGSTAQPVTDSGGSLTIDTPQLPSSLVSNRLDTNLGAWLGSTLPTVGQKVMTSSVPIVIASDQTVLHTTLRSTTSSVTSVAASLTNVTILSANTSRLGATITNDSGVADMFLKLGATASTTSFTVKLTPNAYYEVPFGYTGIINAVWSVATGNARVTELT